MTRNGADDLRAATRLVVEATRGVTDVVEAMHRNIGGGPHVLHRVFVAPTFASIRGVTRLVGARLDRALARLVPLLPETASGAGRDAVLGALNGVLGDYLAASGSPLAVRMSLRHAGRPLPLAEPALRKALPLAGGKLLVLVHGSCASHRQWMRLGHDHGAALARDLGFTPIYLDYNSGLHISVNGREFAALLEELVAAWPAAVDDLVIVAHSMGGLVARSACHYGEVAGHAWRRRLGKLVCIGSPHHGAPLERAGNLFELALGVSPFSAPLARLGRIRSAGVTDMRFGNVLDEQWLGRDRFAHSRETRTVLPLPEGVECYAIAATKSLQAGAGRYADDGIVPVDSALGRHERPELTLAFPKAHQWIAFGTGHMDLLSRRDVYETIRRWISA